MMHKSWSSIEEVPYCFSMPSVKFQGHTDKKILNLAQIGRFRTFNSSFNSPVKMAMKCCTKLETAKERCPIVFQGHPSNFKVTWDETSPSFTQIGHFQTIGRLQLSNPSNLPCFNIFSCDQAALWMVQSVRLSVTPFWLCSHHRIIMKFSGVITNDRSDVHAKGQGQRSRSQRSWPHLAISGL